MLFAAIAARKAASELRMQQIERGEIQAVDPREARERQLREEKERKLGRRSVAKPSPPP
jgi:hypothetical protein